MRRVSWLGVLAIVSSLPVVLLAASMLTGIGLARSLAGVPAVGAALALVLLPVVGLSSLLGGGSRLSLLGGSAWFWSMGLLLALPFYFPGEREEAAAAGLTYLLAAASDSARSDALEVGATLVGWLGSEPESLPDAIAIDPEKLTERKPRDGRLSPDGEVVVSYAGDGQIMRVGVFFDGPRYGEEFQMIFDTGATYTTLGHDALEALEIEVPPDAPVATLRTANGDVEASLVLVDAVWVGDAVVEWVTVAICDLCQSEGVAGLLGLNVSGNFQVALDHADRTITLAATEAPDGRRLDILQWIRLSSQVRRWQDGRTEVEVSARNLAHVDIGDATARIECPSASFEIPVGRVEAHSVATVEMRLPRDTDCSEYTLELSHARWQLDRF